MKQLAYGLGILIILIYALLRLVPIDPVEQRPGTGLAGTLTEPMDVDWSTLASGAQVYVQTNTWYGIPHSVTTITFVDDGVLYIPCGRCETKRWPKNVASDPNVLVKVEDKLFPRRAVLITDMATKHRILDARHKDVALYRMDNPGN
ncbi:MAG: hypothetical protein GKR90_18755 [Pseudomonadales bacterium]|nr:hypothetical protein [Pseudomonadales bacterium]